MLKTYTYRAVIEPGEDAEWVVSFPDVPEAVTQAETPAAARHAAQDALGLALLSYPARGRPLPGRSLAAVPADAEAVDVSAAPDVTAKLAVLEAAAGRSPEELAALLRTSPGDLAQILDPMHDTDLHVLTQALEGLGQRLIVGVAPLDHAA
jgi:antitoxin HicB